MISLEKFLAAIQENVARITHYEKGGDGKGGGCDCIGLIIGAVRLAGGQWTGTHGSNWAARNAMDSVEYITNALELFPGEIVYKGKAPGESGYDLPAAYENSGDLLDYYHVGVVTSIDPLCITHCTSVPGGIQVDNKLGQWRYGGELKYVDYGAEEPAEEPLYLATVTAESGRTVRMRKEPSVNSKILYNVPIGESVDVLGQYDDTWDRIEYKGIRGYMMRRFLASGSSVPEYPEDGAEAVLVERTKLKEIQACLVDALSVVDHLLGVG